MGDQRTTTLTDDQWREVREWLRSPRGRYSVERTSQLSGVPRSTVYDWNRKRILVADFDALAPKQWSYRDLVFLRLTAWLRARGMPRPIVADRVAEIRALLVSESGADIPLSIRSDGTNVMLNREPLDRTTGAQVLGDLWRYVAEFDLAKPIDELGRSRLWGPNLVAPSEHTLISPWVMAGDPCIEGTRLPTSTVFALHKQRGLSSRAIARLYNDVDAYQVDDAIALEHRLRAA